MVIVINSFYEDKAMALKLNIKSRSRGFGQAMDISAARDKVQKWIDDGINVSLSYGNNRKRAGSKARSRYAQYAMATDLQSYINLTNDSDGDWPSEARRDLEFDLSKGLVTFTEPTAIEKKAK